MDTDTLARWVIIAGIITVCIGAAMLLLPRVPFIGRLPGDISLRGDGYSLFIPIATSILLSIALTVVINIVIRLR
jgi:hypothetical protein